MNRPDLKWFEQQWEKPSGSGAVIVRFLGTSSMLIEDGTTRILSDGFVSRPNFFQVAFLKIRPSAARIAETLTRLDVASIAAVFAVHSHYDHAIDSPEFALRTGAVLVGSPSTVNLGYGHGLSAQRMRVVSDGDTLRFGEFELTFIEAAHGEPDRFPGTIDAPLVPPARVDAWKTGTAWSVLVRHRDRTALIHASTAYRAGALSGRRADVVYLGIGGLGARDSAFIDAYWEEVVRATGAKRVILIHWDDFSRGLEKPLLPLYYAADSFDRAVRAILRRADADGVEVVIPSAWQKTDPFRGLTP